MTKTAEPKPSIYDEYADVRNAVDLIRKKLIAFREQKGFTDNQQLAEFVGMSASTLQRYTGPGNKSLMGPDNWQIIVEKVDIFSPAEVVSIGKAIAHNKSIANSRSGQTRYAEKKSLNAALPMSAVLGPGDVEEVDSVSPDHASSDPATKVRQALLLLHSALGTPTVSPLSVMLGEIGDRYVKDGVPAILSSESFQAIETKLWPKENVEQLVTYANYILVQARRNLALIAQLSPDQIRREVLAELRVNLEQFWPAWQAASSVCPHDYVESYRLQRATTGQV